MSVHRLLRAGAVNGLMVVAATDTPVNGVDELSYVGETATDELLGEH